MPPGDSPAKSPQAPGFQGGWRLRRCSPQWSPDPAVVRTERLLVRRGSPDPAVVRGDGRPSLGRVSRSGDLATTGARRWGGGRAGKPEDSRGGSPTLGSRPRLYYTPRGEKCDVPGREGEPPCEPAGIGEGSDGASHSQHGSIPTTRGIYRPLRGLRGFRDRLLLRLGPLASGSLGVKHGLLGTGPRFLDTGELLLGVGPRRYDPGVGFLECRLVQGGLERRFGAGGVGGVGVGGVGVVGVVGVVGFAGSSGFAPAVSSHRPSLASVFVGSSRSTVV